MNKIRKWLKQKNKGSSIVEVLVAVTVVMLMVLMFSTTVMSAAKLLADSAQLEENSRKMNEEYYKNAAYENRKQPENTGAQGLYLESKADSSKLYLSPKCKLQRFTIEVGDDTVSEYSYQILE